MTGENDHPGNPVHPVKTRLAAHLNCALGLEPGQPLLGVAQPLAVHLPVVLAQPRRRLIVVGDFNLTPWSFTLKRQDKALRLRRWTRALASWPAGKFSRIMAAPAPFLPIDHVYAGSDWRAVRIERGPALGSDHRPVVVTLRRS